MRLKSSALIMALTCSIVSLSADETFKMSSLVAPQPVIHSLRKIALTQSLADGGSHQLVFSMALKNNTPDDTFRVGGKDARIHLDGVSIPIAVPYTERGEFKLGAEESVCNFSYPIKDQSLLAELKRIDERHGWGSLSITLIGAEFPIISEKTGKNVLVEMRAAEQRSPTTEITVEFGDVKRHSPWRVKQRYNRASGKRGQLVSIRDALTAINEHVAMDDEMPEHTFAFAKDGTLATICDVPLAQKSGSRQIGVRTVGTTVETMVGSPSSEFLDRPVRDFRKIEFIETADAPAADAKASSPGLSTGKTKTITLPGGATMEMIWCEPGTFMMGSPLSEVGRFDDEPLHRVTLTQGFWLGKYEVTQRQWQSVMGYNQSRFKGENRPIENISWDDCQQFIRTINAVLGGVARLPTEAEWEYACRAGSTAAFSGNGIVNEMAWYDANSGHQTHEVGKNKPNAWGFYDMHGNVLEWCADWFHKDVGAAVDPKGPATGTFRVLRGGCWFYYERDCRSAYRLKRDPAIRNFIFGFRLACSAHAGQ